LGTKTGRQTPQPEKPKNHANVLTKKTGGDEKKKVVMVGWGGGGGRVA